MVVGGGGGEGVRWKDFGGGFCEHWVREMSERESVSTLLALIVVFDLMLVYQELLLNNMKNNK